MKLTGFSWFGYGLLIVALVAWNYVGFDYRILGLLIFGVCLLLVDVVRYYKKK